MYTPVNPSFSIQKWGVRGCSLHGLVFVMYSQYNTEWIANTEALAKTIVLYRNDPTFSDRLVWSKSAGPDQTAPLGAV